MNKRSRRDARTIIFLGISGSGKDTQADFLVAALGKRGLEISTGDGLREMAKRPNSVGLFVKDTMERGGLMPAWGPMYVWLKKFTETLNGNEHVVFTGAPRRIEEAEIMDGFMTDIGRPLPVAIHLELDPKIARKRLLGRGRSDDNRKAILGRLSFFKKHVLKVVHYYERKSRLIKIDGRQTPDAVWRDIRKALKLR